jgi:nicotinamide riboside transporter PnuC
MRCKQFPHRGTFYVAWSNQLNGSGNTDVFLITSIDGGQTWGQAKKVNDDQTTRDQFFPWMTIDQSTGTLYVVFYD